MKKVSLPKRGHFEETGDRNLNSLIRCHYLPIIRIVYRKRIQMVTSLIPEDPIDTLLDIGYGPGMLFPELSKRCQRLHGVDIHKEFPVIKRMLERSRIPSYLTVGDLRYLNYKKSSVDAIVCSSVLEHLRDLSPAISEISEVLKENGIAVVGFPVKNKITKFLFRLLGFDDDLIHPSSHTAILEEVSRHFEIEEIQQFPRFVPRDFSLYISARLRKKATGQRRINFFEKLQEERKKQVTCFFDRIAEKYDFWHSKNAYYHREVELFCADTIPRGSRVLEIGCATGDLLNHVAPETGVGIDLSPRMIEAASRKYPHLSWSVTDIEHLECGQPYDHVMMSNLLEFIPDLWSFLSEVKRHTHPQTRLVIFTVNPLWEPFMRLGARLRLRSPETIRNFITRKDLINILRLRGYEITSNGFRLFLPKKIPLLSFWVNQILPRIPGINNLCALQFIVAKPELTVRKPLPLSCSVIIPCFNEAENIEECVARIPRMGIRTEVIIVDDGSTDSTRDKAKGIVGSENEVRVISYTPNKGKATAVRTGIEAACGDVVMILDADMAVMPEELPRFFDVLSEGRAEFVNGTRMIYPLESEAMKFLNFLGNKIFGILLTLIMEQRNTDTLCGTKAFFRKDLASVLRSGHDAWGDFDLLFEATRKKLQMAELPVHYKPRQRGYSKMKPFRDGASFLRTCIRGLKTLH